ncbi:MAG: inositol monophosphatase family protein [Candidatus Acidiferrales bacterium]
MTSAETNPADFLDVAVAAAREAGEIISAAIDRPKNISYKGEVDLVTETDNKSEAAILAHLRREFPHHAIVAEEGGASGPSAPSEYQWHVDPLDGTTNFAHGYPVFAVSLGLLQQGEPLIAAIYNPVTRDVFTAIRGQGAHRNGAPIHVSAVDTLSRSLLATGFPSHKRVQNPNIHYYWEFTLRSHGVRRAGAAALDLCSVACGQFEGFWEFGLKSWDTAAGILLVREAGGKVTSFSGEPFRPGDFECLASNGLIHAEMQRVANSVQTGSSAQVPGKH